MLVDKPSMMINLYIQREFIKHDRLQWCKLIFLYTTPNSICCLYTKKWHTVHTIHNYLKNILKDEFKFKMPFTNGIQLWNVYIQ